MNQENPQLEYAIQHFHNKYTSGLRTLAEKLDEAGISHYSSGCGIKKITYDIFPASNYVHSLIDLVRLDRNHKGKCSEGLKDCTTISDYNPAHQFLQYLARWSGFTDEIMQKEGDTPRGIAAAQAKLMMSELSAKLSARSASKNSRLGVKVAAATADMDFYDMLRRIGLMLESHREETSEHTVVHARQRMQQNYQKAMQAANATKLDSYKAA